MNPKTKNILIFVALAVIIGISAFYFLRKNPEEADLVSTAGTATTPTSSVGTLDSSTTNSFLTLLLSVRSVSLDDSIFNDRVFNSLRDSTVYIYPDDNNGRLNPFAPIGVEPTPTEESPLEVISSNSTIISASEETVTETPSSSKPNSTTSSSTPNSTTPSSAPSSTTPSVKTTLPTQPPEIETSSDFDFGLDLLNGLE